MVTGATHWLFIMMCLCLNPSQTFNNLPHFKYFYSEQYIQKLMTMCVTLFSSVVSTGSLTLVWSTSGIVNKPRIPSADCTCFLVCLGITRPQTSLRNSRLRHAGMWIESMVREDGLKGNRTGNMCLESSSSCWGSFLSCSWAWIVRIKDTVTRSSNSFKGV